VATPGFLRRSSVRFDLFRVDLSSGELFHPGVRVPIQDQPLQLLRLLLEAEGTVVTPEQLRVAHDFSRNGMIVTGQPYWSGLLHQSNLEFNFYLVLHLDGTAGDRNRRHSKVGLF